MKKFFLFILILLVAAGAVLVVAKDGIAKVVLETGISQFTGFPTKIEKLKLDFSGIVHVQGIHINNPLGFTNKTFVDIPEIFISISLPEAVRQQRIHLREMRLDLQEINIEKNQAVGSNLALLSQKATPAKPAGQPGAEPKKGEPMPFQLDKLVLTIHNVRYEDTSGVVPKKLSADAKIDNLVLTNIADPKAILQMIILKIIKSTPLGNIGVNVKQLEDGLKDNLAKADELVKDTSAFAVQTASDAAAKAKKAVADKSAGMIKDAGGAVVGGGTDALKETVDTTTAVLDSATSSAKAAVSDLFGKKQPETT
ncbi:MAG: hypothetical protein A2Z83_01225 [Omnitrophica bacterium GWA2_52_8]|nr:MAG: hypothetical protein A2Z83_01225 [Omnitrophica bacterium GWA2_52_8]